MQARGAVLIILVLLVTASCIGCTSPSKSQSKAPVPTLKPALTSITPVPAANTHVKTQTRTPTPTPTLYFGKYHPGDVVSGNMENTDGMVILEKSLNESYYKMNPIHMEDSNTGIYTKKYDPKWYSARSVDGSYPAIIGHVNPGYIPVSAVPTTRKV